MSALLPCECGGVAREKWRSGGQYKEVRIRCEGDRCPASTPYFATSSAAAKDWNRRTSPPLPTREEVAEVILLAFAPERSSVTPFVRAESKDLSDVTLDGGFDLQEAADAVLRLLGGEKNDA